MKTTCIILCTSITMICFGFEPPRHLLTRSPALMNFNDLPSEAPAVTALQIKEGTTNNDPSSGAEKEQPPSDRPTYRENSDRSEKDRTPHDSM